MKMKVSAVEKPKACRWFHEMVVTDSETSTAYHLNFLVDDEGIEEQTISSSTEDKEIPFSVMDYLMELQFNPETGELIEKENN